MTPNQTFVTAILFALCVMTNAICPSYAVGPEPVLLWPQGAPRAIGKEDIDRPSLRIYLPTQETATGAGVVICPGGGYVILAADHEGHQMAKWFQSHGIAAFVLQYRLGPRYRHPAPLEDAQRAMRYVRTNAEKLRVSPARIGIMGFSAGGHLASTVATHFDKGQAESQDPIDQSSCRPDFVILAYPVISLVEDFAHKGSRKYLLGEDPDKKLVERLSNERQVTAQTPPAFLFHTVEDSSVPVQNSLAFFQSCLKAGVPAELHVYPEGPHGIGMASGAPVISSWKERLLGWMKTSGFLADIKRSAVAGSVNLDGKPLAWGMITLVPDEADRKPAAFAMVRNGEFSIPLSRGAVVGLCHVEIRNLGGLEAKPSIEEVTRLDKGGIVCQIIEGENQLEFNLTTSQP